MYPTVLRSDTLPHDMIPALGMHVSDILKHARHITIRVTEAAENKASPLKLVQL